MHPLKRLSLISIALLPLLISACSSSKKTEGSASKSKRSKAPVLIMAASQTEQIGMTETPPVYKFLLAWNDDAAPKGFYWYNMNSWNACSIIKAGNYDAKANTYKTFPDVRLDIAKGDTLELQPTENSKGAIPEEIPTDKQSVLYYQQSNGVWKGIPVADITRLAPETVELTR